MTEDLNTGELAKLARFLTARLAREYDTGASSDALVIAAIRNGTPTEKPADLDDFARCCLAFAKAPHFLRKRMLPHLAGWARDLHMKNAEATLIGVFEPPGGVRIAKAANWDEKDVIIRLRRGEAARIESELARIGGSMTGSPFSVSLHEIRKLFTAAVVNADDEADYGRDEDR